MIEVQIGYRNCIYLINLDESLTNATEPLILADEKESMDSPLV